MFQNLVYPHKILIFSKFFWTAFTNQRMTELVKDLVKDQVSALTKKSAASVGPPFIPASNEVFYEPRLGIEFFWIAC